MPQIPSGTVTFLFTDIEGSTAMWERDRVSMRTALERHDEILSEAIESNSGITFKTEGDAFCAVFGTARDGLHAALESQLALEAERWPDGIRVRVRMGLHSGTAYPRGGDYFGPALNRCARLMTAAHGGQTVVSSAVRELVIDDLQPGVGLHDLGECRLRDLTRPERVYQLMAPGLGETFPALRTLDAHPNNLPIRLTSFIGRGKELRAIGAVVVSQRLTTLTGPGGAGKTRLALQAAADLLDEFPGGTWFVDLTDVGEAGRVPVRVADALGLEEEPGQRMVATLIDYIRERRMLIILDNCEHQLDAGAELIEVLLRRCPRLSVLATSRESLHVEGEHVVTIPPMAVPTDDRADDPLRHEAVQLFVERAGAASGDFEVTEHNGAAVVEVCRQLDGIPLAIELAAARIRVMTVQQIARRLEDRFRLLAGRLRQINPHHRTLRAALDWSYDLLSEDERTLLARLSIFRGGWTLGAAEWVCSVGAIADWEVLDLLEQLVEKSLVVVDERAGAKRFRLLESVRAYASEKLEGVDDEATLRDRHMSFFVRLAEGWPDAGTEIGEAGWFAVLAEDHDNVRMALERALERDQTVAEDLGEGRDPALRLAAALGEYWLVRGHLSEGRQWLDRVLAHDWQHAPANLRFSVLRAAGKLAGAQSDFTAAATLLESARTIARQHDDDAGEAAILSELGIVADNLGQFDEAKRYFANSLAQRRQLGDRRGEGASLNNLGATAHHLADFDAANRYYRASLEIYSGLEDLWAIGIILHNLGMVALDEGRLDDARDFYKRSLATAAELDDRHGMAEARIGLGVIAIREDRPADADERFDECRSDVESLGDKQLAAVWLEAVAELAHKSKAYVEALESLATAARLREVTGTPLPPKDEGRLKGQLESLRSAVGQAGYDEAIRRGTSRVWESAIRGWSRADR